MDLAQCGTDWEGISRDCDCINLYWKAKGVMTGFYPRFDVDGLSPECTQFHGAPLIDNRRGGAGFSYVRFPFSDVWVSYGYPQPVNRGMHWYLAFSDSRLPLNWAAYSQNQMAEFFESEGYSALPQGEYPVPDCPCPVSPEGCRFLR